MASAIVGGILNSNLNTADNIFLYDTNINQYNKFNKDCIRVRSLQNGINEADFIFLSVKPQNIKEILKEIQKFDYQNKVFVSICAGITILSIENYLNNAKIIRTMPNTPLLLGLGVTAICKNQFVTDEEFELVKKIFSSSGYVSEIKEEDINGITAITSSSPAYFYLFAKGLMEGAKQLNFNYEDTLEMICKTMIGAANMMLTSNKSLDELISMVKSPNGTTEKALNVLEDSNVVGTISDAMVACSKRAEELSKLN